jgi:hypothetical protein
VESPLTVARSSSEKIRASVPHFSLLKHLKPTEEVRRHACVIEIIPKGDFITYGVGVSLRSMLRPGEAGARIPVE